MLEPERNFTWQRTGNFCTTRHLRQHTGNIGLLLCIIVYAVPPSCISQVSEIIHKLFLGVDAASKYRPPENDGPLCLTYVALKVHNKYNFTIDLNLPETRVGAGS